MRVKHKPRPVLAAAGQRGQAALITVLLMIGAGATALVYTLATPARTTIERDKITAAALAQAKAALIGYAVSVDLTGPGRPGDLPCPDRDNDGVADAVPACSGAALGRLPWKTLRLPDLRDGDGERLWYAISSNFKNNPRTSCAAPGDAGCLNSDSYGTITVRNRDGNVTNDGTYPPTADPYARSGVVAVIIAPGAVLQRQGAALSQDRSCTGDSNVSNCQVTRVCTGPTYTSTALCNPVNYLDILSGTEDNADFVDGNNTNGFINGEISDSNNNIIIVNDRLTTITYQDLMPLLERRVAKEALNCLNAYASVPQNNGRYPWAAPITVVTPPYGDQANNRFGRIPDTFNATFLGISGPVAVLVCDNILLPSPLCMRPSWPGSCSITTGSWWTNWKEMVFYGVAQAYQPGDPQGTPLLPTPILPGGPCGSCLTVDPPSSSANTRVVVIVAGKSLSATAYLAGGNQPRSTTANKQSATNYLEGQNDWQTTPPDVFTKQSSSSTFSDTVQFK